MILTLFFSESRPDAPSYTRNLLRLLAGPFGVKIALPKKDCSDGTHKKALLPLSLIGIWPIKSQIPVFIKTPTLAPNGIANLIIDSIFSSFFKLSTTYCNPPLNG